MTPRRDTHTILFVALVMVATSAIASQTYCEVPEVDASWQALIKHNPGDQDVRELYQLRQSLCRQVVSGSVSIDAASDQLERARQRLIDKWRMQNEHFQAGALGAG